MHKSNEIKMANDQQNWEKIGREDFFVDDCII